MVVGIAGGLITGSKEYTYIGSGSTGRYLLRLPAEQAFLVAAAKYVFGNVYNDRHQQVPVGRGSCRKIKSIFEMRGQQVSVKDQLNPFRMDIVQAYPAAVCYKIMNPFLPGFPHHEVIQAPEYLPEIVQESGCKISVLICCAHKCSVAFATIVTMTLIS
jgi:hypothetical protein